KSLGVPECSESDRRTLPDKVRRPLGSLPSEDSVACPDRQERGNPTRSAKGWQCLRGRSQSRKSIKPKKKERHTMNIPMQTRRAATARRNAFTLIEMIGVLAV